MTSSYGSDRGYDSGGPELIEKVVHIRRVAKVVKGGRRLSFNAMVVVGDGKGSVGTGLGKGAAVPDAVRKGTAIAKKDMRIVSFDGRTIPHAVRLRTSASEVIMKPAPPGAGIIAGGAVRAVLEVVGVKDIVAKALGSRNPINMVKATIAGLETLKGPVTSEPTPISPPSELVSQDEDQRSAQVEDAPSIPSEANIDGEPEANADSEPEANADNEASVSDSSTGDPQAEVRLLEGPGDAPPRRQRRARNSRPTRGSTLSDDSEEVDDE